jgi:arylsulfatase
MQIARLLSLSASMYFTSLLFSACNGSGGTGTVDAPSDSTAAKPNILLIVADDMGFSDIASYGGNIETPVLTKLSEESIVFSNFHVNPTCSPTRSSLLTGNDNHVAGLGIMSETDYPALHALQLPGYSGHLSDEVVTIPEVLRPAGYHTYMVGKWHLGEDQGQNPYDRGFEETFILGTGGGSHWNDRKALAPPQHMEYSRNGTVVEPPADFYSSKNYTDSLIQFIDRNKSDKKPFFAFLSYTAVHDPLHAPEDYIKKYKGRFDKGWDAIWMERLHNLEALGMIPKGTQGVKNPSVPAWDKLSKEHQHEYARDMEVYAAMLDYMDMSIGRVLDYLRTNGLYDNTMIIFMSDNGANGALSSTYPGNADGKYIAGFNNALENRGLKNSYVEQGPGWARASSSPFRYFKTFTTEGGIRVPLMIRMPGSTAGKKSLSKDLVHVTDILPTLIDISSASYPSTVNGKSIHPMIGVSILPLLSGQPMDTLRNRGIGYELFEMKAYIRGNWKILRLPRPMGSGNWELYDIDKDPGETKDLSKQHPDVLQSLIEAWKKYAVDNSVHDHKGHFDSIYRANF